MVISVRTLQKLLRREIVEEWICTAVRSSMAWSSKRTGVVSQADLLVSLIRLLEPFAEGTAAEPTTVSVTHFILQTIINRFLTWPSYSFESMALFLCLYS